MAALTWKDPAEYVARLERTVGRLTVENTVLNEALEKLMRRQGVERVSTDEVPAEQPVRPSHNQRLTAVPDASAEAPSDWEPPAA